MCLSLQHKKKHDNKPTYVQLDMSVYTVAIHLTAALPTINLDEIMSIVFGDDLA